MNEIKWDSSYIVGETVIDKEHMELFDIAKEAFEVVDPSLRRSKIKKTVQKLYEYTKNHFEHEEHFMSFNGFPKYKQHKILHQNVINSLSSLLRELPNMSITEFEKEMAHFIDKGLVKHFLSQDTQIHEWTEKRKKYRQMNIWKESYSTGNGSMDANHKHILDLLSKMFQEEEEPEIRKKNIITQMNQFLELMKKHFKQEEAYMEKVNYVKIEESIKNNKIIISDIEHFIEKLPVLEIFAFEMSLAKSIDKWVITHILEDNKPMLASLDLKETPEKASD